MRFSVTSASAVCISQAQVLGDYILLWIWPGEEDYSLSKLYLISWKHGSITLVRIHLFHILVAMTDDDGSSGKILQGNTDLSPQ